MAVDALEGKLELSQNRDPEDWQGMAEAFDRSDAPVRAELALMMRQARPGADRCGPEALHRR